MEKVVAVTVTYNRVNTLKNTVDALSKQKYNLEKIIVVDNNSTEEHKQGLREIAENNDLVHVVWRDENLGGAGGFHYGVKEALEKFDPDWYWIMDDDAYPREECLENLLSKKDELDNIGFLAPAIYGIDNKEYQMYHHKLISENKVDDITAVEKYDDLKEVTKIEANAFVGPLFPREAIKKAGIPDRDLFIYGDDTEYTYRVSSKGMQGYLIRNAVINHQDPPYQGKVVAPEAWWKEYYMFRNRFLFIKEFAIDDNARKESFKLLKKELKRRILATRIKGHYKGFRSLRIEILKKAIYDGENGISGKTIDPGEYIGRVKEIKKNL